MSRQKRSDKKCATHQSPAQLPQFFVPIMRITVPIPVAGLKNRVAIGMTKNFGTRGTIRRISAQKKSAKNCLMKSRDAKYLKKDVWNVNITI